MSESPPLLYLHGFTGSSGEACFLQEALGRPVFSLDLPGHTPSYSGEPCSMDDAVSAVEHFRSQLGFESADVLGYSMGARVGLALAVQRPHWLRRLNLIGARPGFADGDERRERIAADARLASRIETQGVEAFADYWESTPVIASQASIPSGLREAIQRRRRAHSSDGLACSLRSMGAGAMEPLWDRLAEIQVPTLMLTGERDRRFELIAMDMLDQLPNAQHRQVRGVGHCAHFEDLAEFARVFHAFN